MNRTTWLCLAASAVAASTLVAWELKSDVPTWRVIREGLPRGPGFHAKRILLMIAIGSLSLIYILN